MRRWISWLLVLALIPWTAQAESTSLKIVELHANPTEGREFIEIWNPSNHAVELDDWRIQDAAGNSFTFGNWTLSPGTRVVVWGGGESDVRGPAWTRSTVWNNGGDEATLLNPAGAIVDQFAYGTPEVAAPTAGSSLQWQTNGWSEAEPTPGGAPGQTGGSASAHVENVPPTIRVQAPNTADVGAEFVVQMNVSDPNGDTVSWTVDGPTGAVSGNQTGAFELQLTAPNEPGAATWKVRASDGAHEAVDNVTVEILSGALRVVSPPGGIAFPTLAPGAQNVPAREPIVIENLGSTVLRPRIDISPFAGAGTIPVDGNILLQVGNRNITYAGPLTQLPDLAAGESYQLRWLIVQVPEPLAAGSYGTTYAVLE